jgi:hypothetical protein
MIIAELGDGLQSHVSTAWDGPLIVLCEQDCADQAGDRFTVRE